MASGFTKLKREKVNRLTHKKCLDWDEGVHLRKESIEKWAKNKPKREFTEEIDLLDTMLSSLVELLEEKGIITQEEYEKRIKEKIKVN